MDVLGDETQQRQILGNDYAWVVAALSPELAKQTSAGFAASRSSVPSGQKKRPLSAVRGSSNLSNLVQKRAKQSIGVIDLTSPSPEKR